MAGCYRTSLVTLSPPYLLPCPLSSLSAGFAFLTYILGRMLFLPTWVVAIAMVFLFFYDIIMVFITPFLTEVRDD